MIECSLISVMAHTTHQAPSNAKIATRSTLEQLIEEINFQRAKEMRQLLKDDDGFVLLHGTAYWTELFVRHFLLEEDRTSQESDDLIFFIRKRQTKGSWKNSRRYETELEVFRRDSKKLPLGDPDIDWEETIYTNLIIHQLDYYLTLAVCARPAQKELHLLKRHTERVWASPSRRLMSDKGTGEEITYPNICFSLDNFDEAFTDLVLRDGELISVELVARDRAGALQCTLFLGSVRYEALRRVFDARASLSRRVASRVTFGLLTGSHSQRMEFVRVKGPMGKGHAELAVASAADASPLSPSETSWEAEVAEAQRRRAQQRRLSEPAGLLAAAVHNQQSRGPSADVASSAAIARRGEERQQEAVDGVQGDSGVVMGQGVGGGSPARDVHREPAIPEDAELTSSRSESSDNDSVGTKCESHVSGVVSNAESIVCARTGRQTAMDAREAAGKDSKVSKPKVQVSQVGEECESACKDSTNNDAETGYLSKSNTTSTAENSVESDSSNQLDQHSTNSQNRRQPPDRRADAVPTVASSGTLGSSPVHGAAAWRRPLTRRFTTPASCAGLPARTVTPGMLYRQWSGQQRPSAGGGGTVSDGGHERCTCARTADGTVVHYRCQLQRLYLRQKELDERVYNSAWSLRSLSQSLSLWRESGRDGAPPPLSAYITYVMLPWHAIINDVIVKDNRQDPIISF